MHTTAKASAIEITPTFALAVTFCPRCISRKVLNETECRQTWEHCGSRWHVETAVKCPSANCGQIFQFRAKAECPHCKKRLASGVPLLTVAADWKILDFVLSTRRFARGAERERAHREFKALYDSWQRDCDPKLALPADTDSAFGNCLKEVIATHLRLLDRFQGDVEKFLYRVPVSLSTYEVSYSWKFEEELNKEIDELLNGILAGEQPVMASHEFIARCDLSDCMYSRTWLADEIRRRFNERRTNPKPGFLLTLDYARSLDGVAFEQWLVQLLRDSGVPGVCETKASHDQGADIVISLGSRKVIIQAKNYREGLVGNSAVQQAIGALTYYGGTDAWVVTTSTFSKDAIDLAARSRIGLIDGSRLLNLPEIIRSGIEPSGSSEHSAPVSRDHGSKQVDSAGPAQTVKVQCAETNDSCSEVPDHLNDSRSFDRTANGGLQELQLPSHTRAGSLSSSTERFRLVAWAASIIIAIAVVVLVVVGLKTPAESQTESGIRELLKRYESAAVARNPEQTAKCYAPTVEKFYLYSDVANADIAREFARQYSAYKSIEKFEISALQFTELGPRRATATFDREWDFRGTKNYAGKEREQMIFKRIDGSWRIASEKELFLYWTRPHRVLRTETH